MGALSFDCRHLSVRLSVPCLTLSREWKGAASWKRPHSLFIFRDVWNTSVDTTPVGILMSIILQNDAVTLSSMCTETVILTWFWRLRFLRNRDRDLHGDCYPALRHPELYLLHGGYRDFHGAGHGDLCRPNGYQPMSDRRFAAEQIRCRAESRVYQSDDRYASGTCRRRPLMSSITGRSPVRIRSPADQMFC